jgi:tetratricopeptide (TPR) repeat protein
MTVRTLAAALLHVALAFMCVGTAPAFARQQTTTAPPKPKSTAGQKPATTAPAKPDAATPPAAKRSAPKPPGFDALVKRAEAARAANQLDEAIALYSKAVQAMPTYTEGFWHLGTIYYERDRFEDARDAFRRVTQLNQASGPAWALKGHCEFRLKNQETALVDLLRAQTLGVGENRELLNLVQYHVGILFSRFGEYERALQALSEFALAGNDSPKVIEAMGVATMRLPMLPDEVPGDKREMIMMAGRASYFQALRTQNVAAREALQELINRYPDTPNVHYAYGIFLLNEEADQAIEEFERELKVSPTHHLAMLQIAFEYIKRADYEAAKPWAKRAVDVAPSAFVARKAWGQVLMETGEIDAAIAELKAGVMMAPDSPQMRFTLARAYQRAGRTEDAERERVEFAKLDRQLRASRTGAQSVGGIEIDSSGSKAKSPR